MSDQFPITSVDPAMTVPEVAISDRLRAVLGSDATHAAIRALLAILLAFVVTTIPLLVAHKNPFAAYSALFSGAFGSIDQIAFAINKSTPYMLCAAGIALCFRAQVINIGAEGQIAVGAIATSWVALRFPTLPPALCVTFALLAGCATGAAWAVIAAAIRLLRGVHEVLCTLLMNFIGVLLVSEVLIGSMGEDGAGFPQSPMFDDNALLPNLIPGAELHLGFLLALVGAVAMQFVLFRTRFGFRLRILGGSRAAAAYAGVSFARGVLGVMAVSGGLAGLAGGIEVLGVHYRLIEGFSQGFGFTAVAVALLAAANPLAAIPAALFFGFLQAGSLSMQREVGVPSSIVYVIQGLSIVFVLCAMGLESRRKPGGRG